MNKSKTQKLVKFSTKHTPVFHFILSESCCLVTMSGTNEKVPDFYHFLIVFVLLKPKQQKAILAASGKGLLMLIRHVLLELYNKRFDIAEGSFRRMSRRRRLFQTLQRNLKQSAVVKECLRQNTTFVCWCFAELLKCLNREGHKIVYMPPETNTGGKTEFNWIIGSIKNFHLKETLKIRAKKEAKTDKS